MTNHALLLADALRGGTVLPSHEHLVVDEAHQLEEAAVDALTMRVGAEEVLESIDGALTWFRAAIGSPGEAVRLAAADCRQADGERQRVPRSDQAAVARHHRVRRTCRRLRIGTQRLEQVMLKPALALQELEHE